MITQNITQLPTPPTRQDPVNFSDRADIFLSSLVIFAQELREFIAQINQTQSEINSTHNAMQTLHTITSQLKNETANLTQQALLYRNEASLFSQISSISANFKGSWSPVISYKKGDVVKGYDNALYICLQDNINQPYYDTNYWLRILSHRYSYTQTAPADVWVINHNLYNESIPLVKVFTQSSGEGIQFTLYPSDTLYCGDWLFCGQGEVVTYSTYNEVQYSEIRKINNNTLHIIFPTPIAGIAEIIL